MAISEHLATHTGTVRLLFASDEPFTLEALQTMFDRHTHVIERLEREHAARTTVEAGDRPTVELSLVIQGAERGGPACELEALAAAHDLEAGLAVEGFALRMLRRVA
jgi:hypothetical protein